MVESLSGFSFKSCMEEAWISTGHFTGHSLHQQAGAALRIHSKTVREYEDSQCFPTMGLVPPYAAAPQPLWASGQGKRQSTCFQGPLASRS